MNYDEMKSALLEASDAYYNGTENTMTDAGFDNLKDQFADKYKDDPFLSTIGAPPSENSTWKKVKHKISMNSCNKVNTVDEFEKWLTSSGLAREELVGSEKLDGISLSIDYVDGKLIKATTRGDGKIGEDITPNALRFQNVKAELPIKYTGSLRGEVMMKHEDLDAVNAICKQRGERGYTNVRNGASGIARGLDGQYTEYLYVEYYFASGDFETKTDMYYFIDNMDLVTCAHFSGTFKEIERMYNDYEEAIRAELNHDIDGLVIEPNTIELLYDLGMKHDNFRGQIAWKFSSIKKPTTIIDVVWQLGNSGRLTPVAILAPVKMGGVTVQRASLHNYDMMNELEPYKGAKCIVSRRNDVIPYCESIEFPPKNSKPDYFKAPTQCPVCNEKTKIDGVFLVCDNEECQGGKIGNLKKWIKKLDLLGIGPGIISSLFDAGLVKIPSDFYQLTPDMICNLEGFGDSSAKKIVDTIQSKKELTLAEFIGGLNIPNFSGKTAELLEKNGFDTVKKILNAQENELTAIKGIEITTARAILEGLQKKVDIILGLSYVGITIKEKTKVAKGTKENAFTGKKVVFTGALEIKRAEAQRMVMEVGGECPSSLSKDTAFLVIADPTSTSSKAQKARKFGTQLISEDEFMKIIRG